MVPTINLYASAPASAEVVRAARQLRASGHQVVLRPLAELPAPEDGRRRRRYFLAEEPAQQKGGPQS